jgi:hypothetical protein
MGDAGVRGEERGGREGLGKQHNVRPGVTAARRTTAGHIFKFSRFILYIYYIIYITYIHNTYPAHRAFARSVSGGMSRSPWMGQRLRFTVPCTSHTLLRT